jgi:hypothetical protein
MSAVISGKLPISIGPAQLQSGSRTGPSILWDEADRLSIRITRPDLT